MHLGGSRGALAALLAASFLFQASVCAAAGRVAAAPEADAAAGFSFVAMSDSRGPDMGINAPVLRVLVEGVVADPDVRFVVFPGDMVNGGRVSSGKTRRELQEWRRAMRPVYDSRQMTGLRVYPGVGNHEVYRYGGREAFRKTFPELPRNGPAGEEGFIYSFDHGNSHFVMLDTNRWELGEDGKPKEVWRRIKHLDWLREDLSAARERGAEHLFVFGHEPAFPTSAHHAGDCLPNVGWGKKFKKDPSYMRGRDAFWALLKEFGVIAYVAGHEHANAVQPVDGVHQVLAGGAGAPLYGFLPCSPDEKHYEEMIPYYEALGYPYGEGGNCQASPDFWGSKSFGYFAFRVAGKSVTAEYWGVEPKEDSRTKLAEDARLRLVRSFRLR